METLIRVNNNPLLAGDVNLVRKIIYNADGPASDLASAPAMYMPKCLLSSEIVDQLTFQEAQVYQKTNVLPARLQMRIEFPLVASSAHGHAVLIDLDVGFSASHSVELVKYFGGLKFNVYPYLYAIGMGARDTMGLYAAGWANMIADEYPTRGFDSIETAPIFSFISGAYKDHCMRALHLHDTSDDSTNEVMRMLKLLGFKADDGFHGVISYAEFGSVFDKNKPFLTDTDAQKLTHIASIRYATNNNSVDDLSSQFATTSPFAASNARTSARTPASAAHHSRTPQTSAGEEAATEADFHHALVCWRYGPNAVVAHHRQRVSTSSDFSLGQNTPYRRTKICRETKKGNVWFKVNQRDQEAIDQMDEAEKSGDDEFSPHSPPAYMQDEEEEEVMPYGAYDNRF